jgi:hypothetical protein
MADVDSPKHSFHHDGRTWTFDPFGQIDGLVRARRARAQDGSTVLVKSIYPSVDGAESASFQELRRKLGRLNAENVVRVRGGGVEEGWHYLITDDVGGSSLSEWIDRYLRAGQFPSAGCIQWVFDDVCAGVQAAHRLGLVHRRVCPQAVKIAAQDDRHRVWLADSEVAPLVASASTSGVALSQDFIAPEQSVRPGEETPQTDVFSLAALFFSLRALRTRPDPTSALAWGEWVCAQGAALRRRVEELHGDLPPPVLDVLAGALAVDASARPVSGQKFRLNLRVALQESGAWRERPLHEPDPPTEAPLAVAPSPPLEARPMSAVGAAAVELALLPTSVAVVRPEEDFEQTLTDFAGEPSTARGATPWMNADSTIDMETRPPGWAPDSARISSLEALADETFIANVPPAWSASPDTTLASPPATLPPATLVSVTLPPPLASDPRPWGRGEERGPSATANPWPTSARTPPRTNESPRLGALWKVSMGVLVVLTVTWFLLLVMFHK